MDSLETCIRKKMGLTFETIPRDGKMRLFKVGKRDGGFVLAVGDAAMFGDFEGSCYWAWSLGGLSEIPFKAADREAGKRANAGLMAYERLVSACACGLIDRGEQLSIEDLNRFALAIQRTRGANV